jgi:hypothetical protein
MALLDYLSAHIVAPAQPLIFSGDSFANDEPGTL